MATIGFIGLGVMGMPMAQNLEAAGHNVQCHSRTEATRTAAGERGLTAVLSIAAAVADAEVVISIVPDTPDVVDVMRGDGGVLAVAEPNTLIIDMSTIDPAATRELHTEAVERGHRFVDAPVSGGESGAVEGTLSIMAGGSEADVDAARPYLEVFGSTVVRAQPVDVGEGTGGVIHADRDATSPANSSGGSHRTRCHRSVKYSDAVESHRTTDATSNCRSSRTAPYRREGTVVWNAQ